jgi:DNA-binding CsgD family transcriptional regulator
MNGRSQRIWWAILGFGAFTTLMIIDVATEHEVQSLGEFLADTLELGLIVASATGVAGSLQTERNEKNALARDLKIARAEGEAWRKRAQFYLAGLGEEIEAQFENWQLTQSEREIGLLMLKGFSHGEISSLRGTTEATVRHQARAVYQKSGMPGRSAFCAYFLEDLLPANGQNHARNGAGTLAARARAQEPDARVT